MNRQDLQYHVTRLYTKDLFFTILESDFHEEYPLVLIVELSLLAHLYYGGLFLVMQLNSEDSLSVIKISNQ